MKLISSFVFRFPYWYISIITAVAISRTLSSFIIIFLVFWFFFGFSLLINFFIICLFLEVFSS